MGLLSWMRRSAPAELKATNINELDRLDGWFGRESVSGVMVSETTALQVSGVMACCSRLASDVSSMPMNVKRQMSDGTSEMRNRMQVSRLLRERPNPKQTAMQFRGMMTMQAALHGDALAFVTRDIDNQPAEIWPLIRSEWSIETRGFEDRFHINAYDGQIAGQFSRSNIFHIRPFSINADRGIDRLVYARNAIGLAQSAHDTQARSYRNGNRMPGFWTTDEVLPDEQLAKLQKQLQRSASGPNQWKSPILDRGLGYKPAAQSFSESQLIETRRQELIEICAMFNVLPAVLGLDDKTQAFASVEAMFMAHLRHTLRPWLMCWEQAIDRDLLDDMGPIYCKFDTSDMEKATTKERAESYRTLMDTLVMTPNEAREKEGLPPIAGLNELWIEMQRGKSGLEPSGQNGAPEE